MVDDYFDAKKPVKILPGFFDIDFEFLNDDSVKQIVLTGARNADYHLRLLMAGIPEKRRLFAVKRSGCGRLCGYFVVR